MFIYEVGEFCQNEGGGWSVMIADNDGAFENARNVLEKKHANEARSRIKMLKDDECSDIKELLMKGIEEERQVLNFLRSAKSIEDLHGYKLPVGSDVIRIRKCEVIE